jgi:hypothetical protein
MSTVITCACGARLKLPDATDAKRFRCPACRAEVVPQQAAEVAARMVDGPTSCPICQTIITDDFAAHHCPECDQAHHRECWEEMGGCSIYGCPAAPATAKEAPAAVARSAWGDYKECPACGERIKAIALKCRYCDTKFDTVDPLTAKDLRRRARRSGELYTVKVMTLALFILTFTGCLAPVTLIVGLIFFHINRNDITKAGPVWVVLRWATMALAGLYSVLLVIFALKGIHS